MTFQNHKAAKCVSFPFFLPLCRLSPAKLHLEKAKAWGTGNIHSHLNKSVLTPQQLQKGKERPVLLGANPKGKELLTEGLGGTGKAAAAG